MSKVVSIRLPSALQRVIRVHAAKARRPVFHIVWLMLELSLGGQYNFSALRDTTQCLDDKLDVRLPEELVAKVRGKSARLGISVSVYSRIILDAFYSKRLVMIKIGGHYTLAENHDQTKSA